jgi:hypothetical protein
MSYPATIRGMDAAQGDGRRHPWQEVAAGCGLTLHAALELEVDAGALRGQFQALDASLGDDGRSFMAEDGSWTSIPLVRRSPAWGEGDPTPALAAMPAAAALAERAGWTVIGAHVMRLPPRGVLPWHFEAQAPHLAEARLLAPLQAPQGAVTLIGDEELAYPEGVCWAGDFNFPHQVENRSDQPRVVLIFDVVSGPALHGQLPPAMIGAVAERTRLADAAANMLKDWRGRP